MTRVGGIILCGGQSKRMGRPKAWLPIGGELMLPRVVRLMGEAVTPRVVVAAPEQDLPGLPGEVIVARDDEPGRGPLQGIAAGLTALRDCADAAFVSSCDVPFLRPAFVRRMIELLDTHSICVPFAGEHYHPLAAVYRVEVLDTVRSMLAKNCLQVMSLFNALPTRIVRSDDLIDIDPQMESLRNINAPEDYERAVRVLSDS